MVNNLIMFSGGVLLACVVAGLYRFINCYTSRMGQLENLVGKLREHIRDLDLKCDRVNDDFRYRVLHLESKVRSESTTKIK